MKKTSGKKVNKNKINARNCIRLRFYLRSRQIYLPRNFMSRSKRVVKTPRPRPSSHGSWKWKPTKRNDKNKIYSSPSLLVADLNKVFNRFIIHCIASRSFAVVLFIAHHIYSITTHYKMLCRSRFLLSHVSSVSKRYGRKLFYSF